MQHKVVDPCRLKEQIVADRDRLAEQTHFPNDEVSRRGKLALLVELPVVREVGLRDQPEQPPLVEHDGAIEELAAKPQGCANQENRAQRAARLAQSGEGLLGRPEQRLLVEEVVVAVGREPQFWEEGHRCPLGRSALRERDRPLNVVARIGDPQVRSTNGHAQKIVGIDRVEGWSCHIVGRVPLPCPFPQLRDAAGWTPLPPLSPGSTAESSALDWKFPAPILVAPSPKRRLGNLSRARPVGTEVASLGNA